jgi:uncharacterized LabA/DUF88 family protein
MDLLYSGNLDAFAIVSSDSDFTRLATRLRESGKTVYGMGRRRTPPSLVAACDRFIYLEVLGRADDAPADDPDAPDEPPLPDLRKILTSAVETTSQDDGWAPMAAVGNYLTNTHASFDPRNYGFSKLSALARAQEYLEVAQLEGQAPRVRLRPRAAKATTKASNRRPRKTAKKAAPSSRAE